MAPPTRPAPPAPVTDPADHLSKLPREILAHILSFLPAQEAVRACVLARTWRDVWKLTSRLIITFDEDVSVLEVHEFVDRLLRLRLDDADGSSDNGMAPIDACEIDISLSNDDDDSDDTDDDDTEVVLTIESWIRRVLERPVRSLRVDIACPERESIDSQRQLYVPVRNTALSSRHLTRLELNGLRFTGCCNGCLNLSGCPVLEQLEFIFCDFNDLTKVTSPSVKHLVMTDCSTDMSDRVRICFPGLVSLWMDEFYDSTPELVSMPQLAEAYVFTEEFCSDDRGKYGRGQHITKSLVLEGLAQAKHLQLMSDDNTMVFRWDLRFCPTFSNLKTLVLNEYWCKSANCSELACMLKHAPVLEKLTVLLYGKYCLLENVQVLKGCPDATRKSTEISQHLKIVKGFSSDLRKVSHEDENAINRSTPSSVMSYAWFSPTVPGPILT